MSGTAIAGVVFGAVRVLALTVALIFAYRRNWFPWRQNSFDTVQFENSSYKQEQTFKNQDGLFLTFA